MAGRYAWHGFRISINKNKKRLLGCACIFSTGHLQNKNKMQRYIPVLITALRENTKIGWVLLARQPIFPTFPQGRSIRVALFYCAPCAVQVKLEAGTAIKVTNALATSFS